MRFRIIKKPLYKAAYVTLCPPKINKTKASVMAQETKKINKGIRKFTFCMYRIMNMLEIRLSQSIKLWLSQQESKYYNESLRHYVTAQTMLHVCSQGGLSFITKKQPSQMLFDCGSN